MLTLKETEIIHFLKKSENLKEIIIALIFIHVDKDKNISDLIEIINRLFEIKIKKLNEENIEKYKALEWLCHTSGEKLEQFHTWSIWNAVKVLFPDPIKWKESSHSEATKNFFSKFMKLYAEFRKKESNENEYFKEYSPNWWKEIEKTYVEFFEI